MAEVAEMHAWVLANWESVAIQSRNYVGKNELKNKLISLRWPKKNLTKSSRGTEIKALNALNRAVNLLDETGQIASRLPALLQKKQPVPPPVVQNPPQVQPPPKPAPANPQASQPAPPVQKQNIPAPSKPSMQHPAPTRPATLPVPLPFMTRQSTNSSPSSSSSTRCASTISSSSPPDKNGRQKNTDNDQTYMENLPPPTLMDQAYFLDGHYDDQNISEVDDREIAQSILFTADMFSPKRQEKTCKAIGQYSLLGTMVTEPKHQSFANPRTDGRFFLNTNIPASFFICGVQGSGKSHTLSCILENYLIQFRQLGALRRPLSAMVFHFGQFTSRDAFRPCEAAYLACSDPSFSEQPKVKSVKVLVSPSNYYNLFSAYSEIPGVTVKPLLIHPKDLTISSMLTLMSVDKTDAQPLYMFQVTRTLRDMAAETQGDFDYIQFRDRLAKTKFEPLQRRMLQQRLDLLESFLDLENDVPVKIGGDDGELTIVDLSCPFVDEASACVLFNICIGLYLSGSEPNSGKVIAMDEAHKYMTDTPASKILTNQLLGVTRQQRHFGVRVIIATQEPTISPRLMDLATATIIHRFSSPEWYSTLQNHISAFHGAVNDAELFKKIVSLKVGQALVFAPTALVSQEQKMGPTDLIDLEDRYGPQPLQTGFILLKMRRRLTADGGKSIVCV
ncbi:hypothetical protein DFH27DRAFT_512420 [Peziza echinospora]|nr:hypothetical protein DFH27DRAFT_512420 [Peziza echinospora]